MYLLITKKKVGEKVYQSAKIVESYKLDGKSRQRIIRSLGPVNSNKDLLEFQKILESMKKGESFIYTLFIAYSQRMKPHHIRSA